MNAIGYGTTERMYLDQLYEAAQRKKQKKAEQLRFPDPDELGGVA
jgi:hypothetical protein